MIFSPQSICNRTLFHLSCWIFPSLLILTKFPAPPQSCIPPRTVNCTPTFVSGREPLNSRSVKTTQALGWSTLPFTVNSNSTSVGLQSGEKIVQMPVQGACAAPPTSCMQDFASFGLAGYLTSSALIKPARMALPFSSIVAGPVPHRVSQSGPNDSQYSNSSVFTSVPVVVPSLSAALDGSAAPGLVGAFSGGNAKSFNAAWRDGRAFTACRAEPTARASVAPAAVQIVSCEGNESPSSKSNAISSSKLGTREGNNFSATAFDS
mmetsp:Transcript_40370/g.111210  ORF Transcript_40370/g.111210 Transcript_40370/m.111210 type:complete len:264 (-) Transcript_40370:989-1780(-)